MERHSCIPAWSDNWPPSGCNPAIRTSHPSEHRHLRTIGQDIASTHCDHAELCIGCSTPKWNAFVQRSCSWRSGEEHSTLGWSIRYTTLHDHNALMQYLDRWY